MLKLHYLFFAILIASCNLIDKTTDNGAITSIYLDSLVLTEITTYYQESYGNDLRLVESEDDSTKEMIYYNIPKDKDGYEFPQISISIPKRTGASSIFTGDLNQDNSNDLIVSVYTEGGGGGGNVSWSDLFVFIKNEKGYQLKTISTNWEVAGCNGMIGIEEIKDNKIIGTSLCYAEDDGRCCPSLKYSTALKLVGDQIVVDHQIELTQ